MHHRLFHLLALPLLLVAVLLALVQAWQLPFADHEDVSKPVFSTAIQQAAHEPTAALSDASLWSIADVLSEEPEWPQATGPDVRAQNPRGTLLAAVTPLWPFRGPDALLRPPTTLPCV